jgi:hypothetical protein
LSQEREVKEIKNGVVVSTSLLKQKVQFYDDNIVRVVKWKPGMSDRKTSLSVIIDSLPSVSHSVDQERADIGPRKPGDRK